MRTKRAKNKDKPIRYKKYGLGGMIGTIAGAGLGTLVGQPQIGAMVGGSIGGQFDGTGEPEQPEITTTGSGYLAKGGSMRGGKAKSMGSKGYMMFGKKHGQGGIKMRNDVEVEGGETIDSTGDGYVFSQQLQVPGEQKTFAQKHQELIQMNASEDAVRDLKRMQERVSGRDAGLESTDANGSGNKEMIQFAEGGSMASNNSHGAKIMKKFGNGGSMGYQKYQTGGAFDPTRITSWNPPRIGSQINTITGNPASAPLRPQTVGGTVHAPGKGPIHKIKPWNPPAQGYAGNRYNPSTQNLFKTNNPGDPFKRSARGIGAKTLNKVDDLKRGAGVANKGTSRWIDPITKNRWAGRLGKVGRFAGKAAWPVAALQTGMMAGEGLRYLFPAEREKIAQENEETRQQDFLGKLRESAANMDTGRRGFAGSGVLRNEYQPYNTQPFAVNPFGMVNGQQDASGSNPSTGFDPLGAYQSDADRIRSSKGALPALPTGQGSGRRNSNTVPNAPAKPNVAAEQAPMMEPEVDIDTDVGAYQQYGQMEMPNEGTDWAGMLQYAPTAINLATGLFGKNRTKDATQIKRTKIGGQPINYNINPQLEQSGSNYRAILSNPNASANERLAALAGKNRADSGAFATKANTEMQMREQRNSRQAGLDANRNAQQGSMDERHRQDVQRAQAQLGITGNLARMSMSEISQILQQKKMDKNLTARDKRMIEYLESIHGTDPAGTGGQQPYYKTYGSN